MSSLSLRDARTDDSVEDGTNGTDVSTDLGDGLSAIDVEDVDGVDDITDVQTVATAETVATTEAVEGITTASREDLRLALIPILFVAIYGGGRLAIDPTALPAAIASLSCGLLIADGLFWHSPNSL